MEGFVCISVCVCVEYVAGSVCVSVEVYVAGYMDRIYLVLDLCGILLCVCYSVGWV